MLTLLRNNVSTQQNNLKLFYAHIVFFCTARTPGSLTVVTTPVWGHGAGIPAVLAIIMLAGCELKQFFDRVYSFYVHVISFILPEYNATTVQRKKNLADLF